MRLLILLLLLTSCTFNVKPDTKRGEKIWRLDAVKSEPGYICTGFGPASKVYYFRGDTCEVLQFPITKRYVKRRAK